MGIEISFRHSRQSVTKIISTATCKLNFLVDLTRRKDVMPMID